MDAYNTQAKISVQIDPADLYRVVLSDVSWGAFIDWIKRQFGSTAAALFVLSREIEPRFAATETVRDDCAHYVATGEWRIHDLCGFAPLSFTKAHDNPLPASLRGRGGKECMSIAFEAPNDCRAVLLLWKGAGDRPFTVDDHEAGLSMASHLATAMLLGHSLIFDRARPTLAVLSAMRTAAVVIGSHGAILSVNEQFENCRDVLTIVTPDVIEFVDEGVDEKLQNALQEVRARRSQARAIAVSARHGQRPFVLWVLRLSGLDDPMSPYSPCLLIVMRPGERRGGVTSSVLSTLFDLTPSEVRFVSVLAQGGTLAEIANKLKLSLKSARTYLDRIFAKTGTHRQSDLMMLLRDIEGPRIED